LKKVQLFQPLLQSELERVSDAFHHKHYQKGAFIFSEGDTGDKFYVIRGGTVRWNKKSGEHGELKEGDLFGERALRTNEPRAATIVVTSEKCALWELESKDFYALLGPVVDIIDDKINSYKRSAEIIREDKEVEQRRQTLVEQQKKKLARAHPREGSFEQKSDRMEKKKIGRTNHRYTEQGKGNSWWSDQGKLARSAAHFVPMGVPHPDAASYPGPAT